MGVSYGRSFASAQEWLGSEESRRSLCRMYLIQFRGLTPKARGALFEGPSEKLGYAMGSPNFRELLCGE